MATTETVQNVYKFFNDPAWMDFEGPVDRALSVRAAEAKLAPVPPRAKIVLDLTFARAKSNAIKSKIPAKNLRKLHMESPTYPPRGQLHQSASACRPHQQQQQQQQQQQNQQQRGHRRGARFNTSYNHSAQSRYPHASHPSNNQLWKRTDWDDIYLPNYDEYSDTEFDRPRLPSRGFNQNSKYAYDPSQHRYDNSNSYRCGQSLNQRGRSWRGSNRRTPPRNISPSSHQTDRHNKYSKEHISNKTNSSGHDSAKTNNDKKVNTEISPPGVDLKKLVSNLSFINPRALFEKNDGKLLSTKGIGKNNSDTIITDLDHVPMETIPLLLKTVRNTRSVFLSKQATPTKGTSDSDTRNIPMELDSSESSKEQSPELEEHDISDSRYYKPDTPEVDLLQDPRDKIVSPKAKNKIEIRMDILLSPPKIVINSNNMVDLSEDSNVGNTVVRKTNEDLVIADMKQCDKVEQINSIIDSRNCELDEQLVDLNDNISKDVPSKDLVDNVDSKKSDRSNTLRGKKRSVCKEESASRNCKKPKSTDEKSTGEKPASKCPAKKMPKQKTAHSEKKPDVVSERKNAKDRESQNPSKSTEDNAKPQPNSKKHESSHQKHCGSSKEHKPIEKDKKCKTKRIEEKKKSNGSKDEITGDHVSDTQINRPSQTPLEDASKIIEVAATISHPHIRDLQNIMDSLRRNDSLITNSVVDNQSAEANAKSMMLEQRTLTSRICDNEINEISQARRCETQEQRAPFVRSKSVDYKEELPCFNDYVPAKITSRRRTVVDASEFMNACSDSDKPKRGRRPGCKNYEKWKDPDFKANVPRSIMTTCRVTRSKSREMLMFLSCDSADAVVPKFPDDSELFEQITPPATPRTPRHGETPETLRNMNNTANGHNSGDNSSFFIEEDSQIMNHVYAPTLCAHDPRLHRMISPQLEKSSQGDENAIVDIITQQNTLANKTTAAQTALCKDAHIVLNMLTDNEIEMMSDTVPKTAANAEVEKSETITLYSNQDKNKIACSISIASIGLPDIKCTYKENSTDSNSTNVDIEKLLQEMDAVPRPSKQPIQKVGKMTGPRNNSICIDNTITVPLSSKQLPQVTAPKQFNPYATMSSDSAQRLSTTKPDNSSKEQLKRLFDAEAKQIYMLKRPDKPDLSKKRKTTDNTSKKSDKKDAKQESGKKRNTSTKVQQKKSIFLTIYHPLESTEEINEETTIPMLDFVMEKEQATILNQYETCLHQPSVQSAVIHNDRETMKSLPEVSEDAILNLDDLFDSDIGSSVITEESPQVPRDVKGETSSANTTLASSKAYDIPTIVATIDLLTKFEDDGADNSVKAGIGCRTTTTSGSIVSVEEYSTNVISTIGQYMQMEKLHIRIQDLVKKCTASFALGTVDCDDSVLEFKKCYSAKLGKKFVEYTDSIEIQNFSVTILYTTLTKASLQYNGFKIRRYDVANAICDLYNAAGNEQLRSVFCKQLFQLSNHMKEMELAADIERGLNQSTPSPRYQSHMANEITLSSTSSTITTQESSLSTSLVVTPLLSNSSTCQTNAFGAIITRPIFENISPPLLNSRVNTVVNTPELCAPPVPIESSTPEIGVLTPGVIVHHTPIPPIQKTVTPTPVVQKAFETLSGNGTLVQESTSVVASNKSQESSVGEVALPEQPLVANITSTHIPGLLHTVVLNQSKPLQGSRNAPKKRRVKYTAPNNPGALAVVLNSSSEFGQKLHNQICAHNDLVKMCHMYMANRPAANSTITTSSSVINSRVVTAATYMPSTCSAIDMTKGTKATTPVNNSSTSATRGSTTDDLQLRSLLAYRSNQGNKANKICPATKPFPVIPIPSVIRSCDATNGIVPLPSIESPSPPIANARITVRNINQLLEMKPGQIQTNKSRKNLNPLRDGDISKQPSISNNKHVAQSPPMPSQISIISLPSISEASVEIASLNEGQTELRQMMAEIDDAATQSCIAKANGNKQQRGGRSARGRSTSKGEDSNGQADQNRKDLSRDSGNSSVDVCEDFRESTDFACICGKIAEMICSCKLIVYCSEICQGKDWTRHLTHHNTA